ncbi:MAG: hypothetical protein GX682_01410 [Clostridiaceae bacterium]|nr:hypothetical protein [Clostridiaceae bacterium]
MAMKRQKVKVVISDELKATIKKDSDCFVDGSRFVHGECAGRPKDNKCAACRLRKNYLGIPQD